MKNSILVFMVFCALMLSFAGCGKNELKDVHALVTSVDMRGDTLRSMRATAGGDELLFSLKDVRLNNGLMLRGDSVIVNYIKGRGDTLRALVVTILPKAPSYFSPDAAKDDTLATAPVMNEAGDEARKQTETPVNH